MKRTADIFRGRIIDVTEKTYTIELTGNKGKLDAFIESIERTAILETVRTGGLRHWSWRTHTQSLIILQISIFNQYNYLGSS